MVQAKKDTQSPAKAKTSAKSAAKAKNLVIVESPAKAKTLEKFLGADYKVLSSYGHIRDLKKKMFSVNLKDFTPQYEIPEEKEALVQSLKTAPASDANVKS